jgi:hypothetical protein
MHSAADAGLHSSALTVNSHIWMMRLNATIRITGGQKSKHIKFVSFSVCSGGGVACSESRERHFIPVNKVAWR